MIQLQEALVLLAQHEVEFVIVGGVAASLHGSSLTTFDLDLCYSRESGNLERLSRALAGFRPRLRGAPEDVPFLWDARTLRNGFHFTLTTELGDLDLLAEISGVGGYPQVRAASVLVELFGHRFAVLSVDGLIHSKRAAGRPKDLLAIPELEALREAGKEAEE